MIIVLFPWTCATNRIHSLSGKILNITTDGKQPYVKLMDLEETFYMALVLQGLACVTMNTFRNAFTNRTPRKLRTNSISDELYDAGGKSPVCIGILEMEFEVLGKRFKHPVRVYYWYQFHQHSLFMV